MASTSNSSFDPYHQTFNILAGDGVTQIPIAMGDLQTFCDGTASGAINFSVQLGASMIMFIIVLCLTPARKLGMTITLLHISALAISIVRTTLLCLYFVSQWSNIYAVFSNDYSSVPTEDYQISVAGTTLSILLWVVIQACLMRQAWSLVRLWPRTWKWIVCIISGLIVLTSVALRMTFAVVQNISTLTLTPPVQFIWTEYYNLISSTISIVWFCAIFNIRLVAHLIEKRGLLPSSVSLSPMEALAISNGVLMVFPVVFSGLQFANIDFEAASWVFTSVVLVLPLGSLVAQRMAQPVHPAASASAQPLISGTNFLSKLTNGATTLTTSASVTPTAKMLDRARMDNVDKELADIDSLYGQPSVRVDRTIEQHEESV